MIGAVDSSFTGTSRNDVLGNVAVRLLGALGVFGTGTGRPDVIVAAIMATLALQGAATVEQASVNYASRWVRPLIFARAELVVSQAYQLKIEFQGRQARESIFSSLP